MRVLITGGYGFAGSHLANHFVKCGDDVAVSYLPQGGNDVEFVSQPASTLPSRVQAFALDITNREAVFELLSITQPDVICHLAAITFVPDGERSLERITEVNTNGTLNILDAVKRHSKSSRVLVVSSSEVYGCPKPGTLPLTEEAEFLPNSNYGLSKAWMELAAYKYSQRDELDIVRARPFPHVGPGQSANFALASFTKQIAEIKLGKRKPIIEVGNLETRRDISDVEDIVRGYREAVLNGKRGRAYNLASGKSHEIGELLRKLMAVAEVEAEIQVKDSLVRKTDISDICGSYDLAQKDFGWKPRIDLDGTLHSLYAYWIETLSK